MAKASSEFIARGFKTVPFVWGVLMMFIPFGGIAKFMAGVCADGTLRGQRGQARHAL